VNTVGLATRRISGLLKNYAAYLQRFFSRKGEEENYEEPPDPGLARK